MKVRVEEKIQTQNTGASRKSPELSWVNIVRILLTLLPFIHPFVHLPLASIFLLTFTYAVQNKDLRSPQIKSAEETEHLVGPCRDTGREDCPRLSAPPSPPSQRFSEGSFLLSFYVNSSSIRAHGVCSSRLSRWFTQTQRYSLLAWEAPHPVAHPASASRCLTSPGRPVHPTVFICIFSLPTYSQNLFMGYQEDLCAPSSALASPRTMEASEAAGHLFGVAGGSFLCCVCQQGTNRTRRVTQKYIERQESGSIRSEGKMNDNRWIEENRKAGARVRRD